MKLSKNFSLEEMLVTSTGVANVPTETEIENLRKLAVNVLQPLREYMQRPVIITSGFRCKEVNKRVGGSKTSGHMLGTAADITAGNRTLNKIMYDFIRDNCEFRQLINEYNYRWVHVEYREGDNKKQELIIN